MKTFLTNSIYKKLKRAGISLALTGIMGQVAAQCPVCPGGSTNLANGASTINSTGTYCIQPGISVSNLTINATNVTLINRGSLNGILTLNGQNPTVYNCNSFTTSNQVQIQAGGSFSNYGTYNGNGGFINNGGTFTANSGAQSNFSAFTNNTGTFAVNGNVSVTNLTNYATINGNNGTITATSFGNYGPLNGPLTVTNGRPNPSYGTIASNVQFYSCANVNKNGSWTQKASLPSALNRLNPLVFTYNGKIYAGLGYRDNAIHNTDLYVYDPAANTWTQTGPAFNGPTSQVIGQPVVIGTKVYFVIQDYCTLRAWEYDLATSTWTGKANSLGSFGTGAFSFTVNNKIYYGGGYYFCSPGFPQNGLEEYNPATNTWTSKGYLPASGSYAAFTSGGKGYIVGGNDWGPIYKSTYQYNEVTNTWIQKTDFPYLGLGGSTATGLCSYGFVYYADVLGTPPAATSQVWRFNTATNAWSQLASFSGTYRTRPSLVTLDGNIYLFGGTVNNGTSTSLNELWVFNPKVGSVVAREEVMIAPEVVTPTASALTIAPNPANTVAAISYKITDGGNASLKITDVATGATVHQETLNNSAGVVQLHTENWTNGVYVCTLQSNGVVISNQRLVVNR